MRIEIDIPKEFEEHFKQDKFKDSFERIMADIKHSLENGDCLCAGRYEYETIEMLEEALENSKTAYDVDKVVEEIKKTMQDLNVIEVLSHIDFDRTIQNGLDNFLKAYNSELLRIVKQGGVADDVCEWTKIDEEGYKNCECNYDETIPNFFKYCPYCGKKIKVVY